MIKFHLQNRTDLPDRVFVTIDDRYSVALIRSENGLAIEVFPITDGEVWCDPFGRFYVDEEDIRELEREIGQD